MPHYVNAPKVDPELVQRQCEIIKQTWPEPTDLAWEQNPKFCELYSLIKSYNAPNFLGAKVTVDSELHLEAWELELSDYHDNELCYFLLFGWPVGFHSDTPPVSVGENHASAKAHMSHLYKFIETELKHQALAGPFTASPFQPWTRLSPLMTREKKDSDSRRVIVDLSFPAGHAVNDGIQITSIFGRDC